VIKVIIGLRVSEEEEANGVDLAECGMEAYPEFTSSKS
jgi:Amt family ammonium transporter